MHSKNEIVNSKIRSQHWHAHTMQILFSHAHMCLSAIVPERKNVSSLSQNLQLCILFQKKFHALFTSDQNTHSFKMLVAHWDPTFSCLLHMILNLFHRHQSFKLAEKTVQKAALITYILPCRNSVPLNWHSSVSKNNSPKMPFLEGTSDKSMHP